MIYRDPLSFDVTMECDRCGRAHHVTRNAFHDARDALASRRRLDASAKARSGAEALLLSQLPPDPSITTRDVLQTLEFATAFKHSKGRDLCWACVCVK